MKKKWVVIFGYPALCVLVVMAGEAILFQRIVIRQYVTLYIAFVGIVAWNVLRPNRE